MVLSRGFLKKSAFFVILASIIVIGNLSLGKREKAYAGTCSTTTLTVTQTSLSEFIIDTGQLDSAYVSYKINTGASVSFTDLWVKAESFSDTTKLNLATNEDGLYHVGAVATNTNVHVYFFLKGAVTNSAQNYTLNMYNGKPGVGGTSTCTQAVSNSKVSSEIQAVANKVTSAVHTAPYVGGTMTITVTGQTGIMSSTRPEGSVFSYTPASLDAWPADCYELYDTNVVMTGGNTLTKNQGLLITTAADGIGSVNTDYVITYYLRAKCTTASPTAVNPVNYISSGNLNLKHTDTTNAQYAAIEPIEPATNYLTLNKAVSPMSSASGGTATYTVTFTNTASSSVTFEMVKDILPSSPANATYITNTSKYNGVAISNPNISGQTLTWTGSFTVPANGTRTLTYNVTVPNTVGAYTNSATAFIGSTQIDKTIITTDNTPATAVYGVGNPNLIESTKTVEDINGGSVNPGDTLRYTITAINTGSTNATGVNITDTIDSDTQSLTNIVISASGSSCGGTTSNLSTSTQLIINNVTVRSNRNCVITFDVTVKANAADNAAITNTATLGTPGNGGVGGSATSQTLYVQTIPVLSVTKTENDADNFVAPGQTVTYTVTITNSGSKTGTTSFTDAIDSDYGSPTNFTYTNCGGSRSQSYSAPTLTVSSLVVTTSANCVVTYDLVVKSTSAEGATLINSVDVAAASEGGNNPAPVAASTLTVNVTPNLSTSTKTENDENNIVTPGQTVNYTITVINTGDGNATGVNITDTVNTHTTIQTGTVSLTNCGTYTNNTTGTQLNIVGADIAVGTNCVVTFDVVIASPLNEGTVIDNTATISAASEGGSGATVSSSNLTVDATPALAVTKTENDADNVVTPGQTVTYTVTITNSGNGNATTSFTDAIDSDYGSPSNFTYTNCGGSRSQSYSAPTLTVSSLVVTTSANCVITYDLVVKSPSTEGATLVNSADVAAASEGGNNPAPVAATTLTINVTPNLSTSTKTENDADNFVTPGQTVTYTITVINTGDGNATGVNITDTVNTHTTIQTGTVALSNCGGGYTNSSTGTKLDITGASIAVGTNCVVTFDVVIASPLNEGTVIDNTATISAASEGGSGATPSSSNLTVNATPNFETSTKTVDHIDSVVTPGETVTYTITVINTGNGNATGVSITDTVNIHTTIQTGTVSLTNCGTYTNNTTGTQLNIVGADIAVGTNCVISFDVVIANPLDEGTIIDNTATISAANEGGSGSSPSSDDLTVSSKPVLSTSTKTENDSDNSVTPGQTVTYTITVINTGDSNATGVSITDTVNTHTTIQTGTVSLTNCGTYTDSTTGSELDIAGADIVVGTNCVVTFDVVIESPLDEGTIIDNTATISAASEGGLGATPSADNLTVDAAPNLSTSTKTENDADNNVTPGQTVTYTITVVNTGDGSATGVNITDTVNTHTTIQTGTVSLTNCGTYTNNTTGTELDISDVSIAVGTNCIISFDIVIESPLDEGTIIDNTATISAASEGGSGATPSSDDLTVDATPNLDTSTKTENDEDDIVAPGQTVSYTITVVNSGDGDATGVNITDTVNTHTTIQTGTVSLTNCGIYTNNTTGTQLNIAGADIEAGTDCVISFDVVVDSPLDDGTVIDNTATISAASEGGLGATPSSDDLTVSSTPGLSTSTKTENDADNIVTPGQTVTYTITVINTGNGNATGVNITDTVNTHTTIQTGTVSLTNCGTYTDNTTSTELDIAGADIAIGTDCVISFDVVIEDPLDEGTIIDNTATISAASEGGSGATVSSSNLTVDATPALEVTKTENDADNVVTPGQTVTYTVTITNSGNGSATTSFTDAIDSGYGNPSNFTYTNCGGSHNKSYSAPTLTVSSLVVSTSANCVVTYDLLVKSPSTEGATLVNSVDVAAASEGGNDPAAVAATTLNYDANDSADPEVENASPNDGDANNDGKIDDDQPDVTSFINTVNDDYAVLENDSSCINKDVSQLGASSLSASDQSYKYPLGLMTFRLVCGTPGVTVTVTQYYYSDLDPATLIARKFDEITKTYTTITNADISRVSIDNRNVIKITYAITDGGTYDDDGIANGIIIDPAGPAQLSGTNNTTTGTTTNASSPNTGLKKKSYTLYAVASIIGLASMTVGTALIIRKRVKA